MSDVVVDANVLVAIFDKGDKWNKRASAKRSISGQEIISELMVKGDNLVILDFIVFESISVLVKRLAERKLSSEQINDILKNFFKGVRDKITWVGFISEFWFDEIFGEVLSNSGKLNFNDAFIVVFCRRIPKGSLSPTGIKKVLSFDSDFDDIKFIERIY